ATRDHDAVADLERVVEPLALADDVELEAVAALERGVDRRQEHAPADPVTVEVREQVAAGFEGLPAQPTVLGPDRVVGTEVPVLDAGALDEAERRIEVAVDVLEAEVQVPVVVG